MNTQQLKELARRATPWPWKWFTSNSHNRLSSIPSGKDGDVISAFKAVDGVACVSVSRADMAFIEAAHPGAVIDLIERLEPAERERDELRDKLLARQAVKEVWQDRAWSAEEEIARRDAAVGEVVAHEFMPENLDRALTVMGIALPISKEEFNFQAERWCQRLINRVIKFGDEISAAAQPAVSHPVAWRVVYNDGRDFELCATEQEAARKRYDLDENGFLNVKVEALSPVAQPAAQGDKS